MRLCVKPVWRLVAMLLTGAGAALLPACGGRPSGSDSSADLPPSESAAGTGVAAQAEGLQAEGIRVPDYDANGRLTSELFGDAAHELADGTIEVSNLRLNMYKEGRLDGFIITPRCIYNRTSRMAFSNSEVTMQRGNLLVSGIGFRWYTDKQVLEILNRSSVIIKDVRLWAAKE
jgi:hypothetical protein